MKNLLITKLSTLYWIFINTSKGINYQAVEKYANGNVLMNQAIAYLFVWEPSQLPSESFVLPHWHLPLLLDFNSIIMFFRFVEVERVDKFIVLIFIKFKKIKVVK